MQTYMHDVNNNSFSRTYSYPISVHSTIYTMKEGLLLKSTLERKRKPHRTCHHQINLFIIPQNPTTLLTPRYPTATMPTVAITKVCKFRHSTPLFLKVLRAVDASLASRSVVVVVSYCGMYLNSKTVSPPKP